MAYTTIERARIQLLLTQPFFATLIYQTDFVSDTSVPYAATDGRRILINEGALNALPIEEVKTILAHEIAHIRHKDILIGSVAAAVATGISAIANMAMFAGMFGGGDDEPPF